jgi:hypothetical protein
MRTINNRFFANPHLLRDFVAILLLLGLGILGEIVVWNPFRIVAPDVPMLSTADWNDSQYVVELLIAARSWQEERSYLREMSLVKNGAPVAGVNQQLEWYADIMEAKAVWMQNQSQPYGEYPLIARSNAEEAPKSTLFCSPPDAGAAGECIYRACWKHWFTYVTFYIRTPTDLPLSEVQKLTKRIDEHLMSAPDKPCVGLFCGQK